MRDVSGLGASGEGLADEESAVDHTLGARDSIAQIQGPPVVNEDGRLVDIDEQIAQRLMAADRFLRVP